MDADVTVIVPTYNRCDLLQRCLESLAAQTYRKFETLVIDDGSSEDISAFAAEHFPEVEVIRLAENGGFAVAANAGLRRASTPYVFLLNNDMTLEADCLERLVRAIEDGAADMVAPLVLWDDDHEQIYSAGDRILRSGRPEAIGFREPVAGFACNETPFGVSGGAALLKRSILGEIGYLDERFIAYFEDSDLCFRAQLAGYSAAVVMQAKAYHVGSASIDDRMWWRSRQCFRNHTLLVVKNMPRKLMVQNAQAIAQERLHQFKMFYRAARAEHGLMGALQLAMLAALDMIALMPHAWRERQRIQRTRKLSDDALMGLLAEGGSDEHG